MNKRELLNSAFLEARAMVLCCGIEIGEIREVNINTTSLRTWGWCKYLDGSKIDNKICSIEIADKLVNEKYYNALLNTLVHEILHTAKGCRNHDKLWKAYAEKVNKKYGLDVQRCNGYPEVKKDMSKYTHHLECETCKHQWHYYRSTYAVRYPERCACPICHNKTIKRIHLS